MPRFAANLTMMFNEWPFLDRFDAAAFPAVEFLFPYEHAPEALGERLARNGLTQALFNLPPRNWAAGERGLAALPERFDELQAGVGTALSYAEATGATCLHLMSGLGSREDQAAVKAYRKAVIWAAGELADRGLTLVIEPINGRDMPGYFLNDFVFAEALMRDLALPNLKLQFDVYHRQILHGDVIMALRGLLPIIGHLQIASVPSRHEPTCEELNDHFIFEESDRLGYDGFVGCEYRPQGKTLDGLGWFAPFAGERERLRDAIGALP